MIAAGILLPFSQSPSARPLSWTLLTVVVVGALLLGHIVGLVVGLGAAAVECSVGAQVGVYDPGKGAALVALCMVFLGIGWTTGRVGSGMAVRATTAEAGAEAPDPVAGLPDLHEGARQVASDVSHALIEVPHLTLVVVAVDYTLAPDDELADRVRRAVRRTVRHHKRRSDTAFKIDADTLGVAMTSASDETLHRFVQGVVDELYETDLRAPGGDGAVAFPSIALARISATPATAHEFTPSVILQLVRRAHLIGTTAATEPDLHELHERDKFTPEELAAFAATEAAGVPSFLGFELVPDDTTMAMPVIKAENVGPAAELLDSPLNPDDTATLRIIRLREPDRHDPLTGSMPAVDPAHLPSDIVQP